MTVLMALSSITMDHLIATEKTMSRCTQLLDYLAGHSDAKVRFHASDMILNIHSDASYLSEAKAVAGHVAIFSSDGCHAMANRFV